MPSISEAKNLIKKYVSGINTRYASGIARENAYRGDLQSLMETFIPGIIALNDAARIECGAPDFILRKGGEDFDFGYIEAKDIGKNLASSEYVEQFDRYRSSLNNLIITDYLNFELYQNGIFVRKAKIASRNVNKIVYDDKGALSFFELVTAFSSNAGQAVSTASQLANVMAGKARLLADVIVKALESSQDSNENTSLHDQMRAFDEILIKDISARQFADLYSQTVVYGMFAARLHDAQPNEFTRLRAAQLIPKSNPFLRKLFQYISGYDIDSRIEWIVDSLSEVFRLAKIDRIVTNFGTDASKTDPVLHFYETFLAQYDVKLRKARGVWYTPQPVVSFIVRSVDNILKEELGIEEGLADTQKVIRKVKSQIPDKRTKSGYSKYEVETNKVMILDPATGTGTFLAEVIKTVHKNFAGEAGVWSEYVAESLLPRLFGFELLMAPYAMAHLKLELLLESTGYDAGSNPKRLNVFLTNALEEHHPDSGTLFASWLSQEANEANYVKRDAPVMVVIGNPPYSAVSSNMGNWMDEEIKKYTYIDGVHFGERKHWLNDDYVRFFRYAEHFIEKNGEGVLGYITNHSFLDNPTFRGMRWHFLQTFDKIYVIDLHGNAMRGEVGPDGPDKNVFDIQQGVAITLAVKKSTSKDKGKIAEVFHLDLWGKRESKYKFLDDHDVSNVSWVKAKPNAPYFFLKPKDFSNRKHYEKGVSVKDIFKANSTGIVTMGDGFIISRSKDELRSRIKDFLSGIQSEEEMKFTYALGKNYAKWAIGNKSKIDFDEEKLIKISMKPFDDTWTYYDPKLVWRCRDSIMSNFIGEQNVGMAIARQCASAWRHVFVSDKPIEFNLTGTAGRYGSATYFPLYTYAMGTGGSSRHHNISPEYIKKIRACASNATEPEAIFDYIYGVLHAPSYREFFEELLKVDYPKIPSPVSNEQFQSVSEIGASLRKLHLLKFSISDAASVTYSKSGSNVISKIRYDSATNKLFINDDQYFSGIDENIWIMHIGAYQPLQRWLQSRLNTKISHEDVRHFRLMAHALGQTLLRMIELDEVLHETFK